MSAFHMVPEDDVDLMVLGMVDHGAFMPDRSGQDFQLGEGGCASRVQRCRRQSVGLTLCRRTGISAGRKPRAIMNRYYRLGVVGKRETFAIKKVTEKDFERYCNLYENELAALTRAHGIRRVVKLFQHGSAVNGDECLILE